MRAHILRTCLAALVVLGALSGCSDDSTAPEQSTPPALPSVSTMRPALDFYGIEPPTQDPAALATGKPGDELFRAAEDHSNWINGYVRAVFLTLVTYDLLEEPVGAFAAAIHSVPQAQHDGAYLWTYIFVDGDIEYSVFLTGTPREETVAWRMEVSSNNPAQPLDHFLWFEGESRRDELSGNWVFYQPVDNHNGVEVARVNWTSDRKHESELSLSVTGSGLENEGDAIAFYRSRTYSLIRYYDASEDVWSEIDWNAQGAGSITVPDYNDGERACWDKKQVNVACPSP